MSIEQIFQKEFTVTKQANLSFLLSLPSNSEHSEDVYPLVLFLHGMGERGNDVNKGNVHGIPKVVEEKEFPFIMGAPQCPDDLYRYSTSINLMDELKALIDHVAVNYRGYKQRIYVPGLSMGGYGT